MENRVFNYIFLLSLLLVFKELFKTDNYNTQETVNQSYKL